MDAKSVKPSKTQDAVRPRLEVLSGGAQRAPSAGPPPYLADPSSPDAIALRQLLDTWAEREDASDSLPRPVDAGAASPGLFRAMTVSRSGDTGGTTPARAATRAGVVLCLAAQRREGKV